MRPEMRCWSLSRSGKAPSFYPHPPLVKGEDHLGCAALTIRDIVDHQAAPTLNSEINAALAELKMKARIAELGATAVMMSPTEADNFVLDEIEKWAPVVKSANIKLK